MELRVYVDIESGPSTAELRPPHCTNSVDMLNFTDGVRKWVIWRLIAHRSPNERV